MYPDLAGKVALVTGSSRGIGRAIAIHLAREGATVALNATRDVAATQDAIKAFGGRCSSHTADVSRSDQVESMVAAVLQQHGSIDILVNNAGINRDALLLRLSDQDWDDVIGTNLRGSFLCTRAVLKPMVRKRWGRIISIGSVVAKRGNPGQANYTAAKGGLVSFSRSVALEVASRGITVNVVAPGFIETEMTQRLTEPVRDQIRRHIPFGEFATPDDVAEAVTFLAGEDAGYITGQAIYVDGGLAIA